MPARMKDFMVINALFKQVRQCMKSLHRKLLIIHLRMYIFASGTHNSLHHHVPVTVLLY